MRSRPCRVPSTCGSAWRPPRASGSRPAPCDCVNLLLNYPEGCYANCTYCGLARERPGLAQDNTFIRVGWPVYPTDLVAEAVADHEDRVGRGCVAVVQDKG